MLFFRSMLFLFCLFGMLRKFVRECGLIFQLCTNQFRIVSRTNYQYFFLDRIFCVHQINHFWSLFFTNHPPSPLFFQICMIYTITTSARFAGVVSSLIPDLFR